MISNARVAILGATGAVGQEFIKLIEERNFPYSELKLLASKRSAGKELTVKGKKIIVEEATPDSFNDIDIRKRQNAAPLSLIIRVHFGWIPMYLWSFLKLIRRTSKRNKASLPTRIAQPLLC